MYKLSLAKCSMVCVVILLMITSACVPYSKLKYFNDIDELEDIGVTGLTIKKLS